MDKLQFKKCCVCLELRTGCIILVAYKMIVSLLCAASMATLLLAPDQKYVNVVSPSWALAIHCVYRMVTFVFYILLLHAIIKNKKGMVNKGWMIMLATAIPDALLEALGFLASAELEKVMVGIIICFLFLVVLYGYFSMCVRSHYLVLNRPLVVAPAAWC